MGMTPAKWQEFIDKSRMTKTAAPHEDWTPEQWQGYARSVGMDPQLANRVHDWNSFRIGARYNPATPQTSWGDVAHDVGVSIPRGIIHGVNDVGRIVGLIPAGLAYATTPAIAAGSVLEQSMNPNSSYNWRNILSSKDGVKNAYKAFRESFGGAVDSVTDSTKRMYQQIQGFDDAVDDLMPFRDRTSVAGAAVEGGARAGSAMYTGAGLAENAPTVNHFISPGEWKPVQAAGKWFVNSVKNVGNKVMPKVMNTLPDYVSQPLTNGYRTLAEGTSYPALGTTADIVENMTGVAFRPASVVNNTGRAVGQKAVTGGYNLTHHATQAPVRHTAQHAAVAPVQHAANTATPTSQPVQPTSDKPLATPSTTYSGLINRTQNGRYNQ